MLPPLLIEFILFLSLVCHFLPSLRFSKTAFKMTLLPFKVGRMGGQNVVAYQIEFGIKGSHKNPIFG
jgi:hypothetical protein